MKPGLAPSMYISILFLVPKPGMGFNIMLAMFLLYNNNGERKRRQQPKTTNFWSCVNVTVF
jgi:hypothetical protein